MGQFDVEVTFGPLGCEEAARDTQLDDPGEPKNLGIFAGYDPSSLLFVLTRAEYHLHDDRRGARAARSPLDR